VSRRPRRPRDERAAEASVGAPDHAPAVEAALDPAARVADDAPRHTPLWRLLSGWLLGLEAWLRSHGGAGLRRTIRVFWGAIAAVGALLLFGPVINPPMSLDDITSSASHATDRWIAREFAADYVLDLDEDGRLVTTVEERIQAYFPDDVDLAGIERVLAVEYEGHALRPSGISATLDGDPIEVGEQWMPTVLTLELDGPGERLSGDHEFVLRYTLHDLAYETVDDGTGRAVDLFEWDVFGPSWPQGMSGLDVSLTLPDELDDRLIRQARGSIAWTLIGGGAWLTPEPGAEPGTTTYGMTNDQNIPPHAQAWFTLPFESGSIAMPGPTPLFILMSFGPLLPLALLVVMLLFALAARAVAWADARGRPWYVAQHEPPSVSLRTAAHVLGTPRTIALAEALAKIPRKGPASAGDEQRYAAARAARRTGRLGDLPRALTRFLTAPERRTQVSDGLRRVPRGFVRDAFLLAPPALVLLQWGLVRQLSEHEKVIVVWWPLAFVLGSTAIALVIVVIAAARRPLTRRGALLKQHLLGVRVFAERTQLLDRGPSRDVALPFAVLQGAPRETGRRIGALLAQELGESGERATRGWRGERSFLTIPRLLVIGVSLLLVPGAIAMIVLVPNPYVNDVVLTAYDGDVKGTLSTVAERAEFEAVLSRTDEGRAQLSVTEHLRVAFADEVGRVPQFAEQWPNEADGQPLDVHVDSVRIDGRAVPFATEPDGDTLLMRTELVEVLEGTYDVEVEYTVASAAYAADVSAVGLVDRVRWAALIDGWEFSYPYGAGEDLEGPVLDFRLSDELAALARNAGWISLDTDGAENARDWPDSVVPFGEAMEGVPDLEWYEATDETNGADDGMQWHRLVLQDDGNGYPFYLTVDDLGVSLDFPAGTFTGPDAAALRDAQLAEAFPATVALVLAILGILLGAIATLAGLAGVRAAFQPGLLRDLFLWLGPLASLASLVLAIWLIGDLPSDHPMLPALGLPAVAAVGLSISGLVLTQKRRVPVE
jgi:hypothetical protein